jgi:hypothetical protein
MTSARKVFFRLVVLVSIISFGTIFANAEDHKVLIVGKSGLDCPQAQFTRIQDAIDAATPRETIHICRGVYNEQLHIDKSLDINASYNVFLMPEHVLSNATNLSNGEPVGAVIYASNAEDVRLSGFTLEGLANGMESCSPRLIGIYFKNTSGVLDGIRIRNFKLRRALGGCRSGGGVFIQSGKGGKSTVEIENVFIQDYQKNGITAGGKGTNVSIHDNIVTGMGPTSGAPQNGIQVGFGATGIVSKNTVMNNIWSPCQAATSCEAVATDILVVQSDNVKVIDNTVGLSQVGIFMTGNKGLVARNKALPANAFEGVRVKGNENIVVQNTISESLESDILVQGNENLIEENTLAKAPVGILKTKDSVGNKFAKNKYIAVAVRVQDSSAWAIARKVAPVR